MTIKSLTGVYLSAGYTLKSTYGGINVAANAGVGGSGLTLSGYGTVNNLGVLRGIGLNAALAYNDGLRLNKGGSVDNGSPGAYIGGNSGVYIVGAGAVYNSGFIRGTASVFPGVLITGVGSVVNEGTIVGMDEGVNLENDGNVRNGDSFNLRPVIQGNGGVNIGGSGNVSNYGSIIGFGTGDGVGVTGSGAIANGLAGETAALISGSVGVEAGGGSTINNFGTILGNFGAGVRLDDGGSVVNGAATDTVALVSGYGGVVINAAAGIVKNFGTVRSSDYTDPAGAIQLNVGGSVTNGVANDPGALVAGYTGVLILGAAGTVTNFGVVTGLGGVTQSGVACTYGGEVTNGALGDTTATISGAQGVSLGKAGAVVNFGRIAGSLQSGVDIKGLGAVNNQGTISGGYAYGVSLEAGGSLINGGGSNRSALIEGNFGVDIEGGLATVANFGTILAEGSYAFGVYMRSGGTLTNGSVNNSTALIEGVVGLQMQAGDKATNFGTIWGIGDTSGPGVYLLGGSLTNGAASKTSAVIEGYLGVNAGAGATLTNFGTIAGAAGVAVQFSGAGDTLVAEAGSVFLGSVFGGNGTLELGSGTGTIAGTLSSKTITVAGAIASTTFHNFNALEVAAGASFTLAGSEVMSAGQRLIDLGNLTIGGAATNSGLIEASGAGAILTLKGAVPNSGTLYAAGGVLSVTGAVTGAGTAKINGGSLDLGGTFAEAVAFTGATGILQLAKSATYTGTITGFSKTGATSLDLLDIAFVAATKATYSGTSASGTLTVTDGVHTSHIKFAGDYTASAWVLSSDGHGGIKVIDPTKTEVPYHPLIGAMAGFGASSSAAETWTATEVRSLSGVMLATHAA